MGDMVCVHVNAFKARHTIQSRWVNREYVVEWQPNPNLPVYVVHLIDGGRTQHTLHRNYLLPISNNLEQGEGENFVGWDGLSNEPTPIPQENDALPVNHLTMTWLEIMPKSLSKQHELFDPGLTSMDPTDEGLQADNDTPVSLRWISRTMRNQLPWSYQNLALQQNDIFPSPFNVWVGLCFCLCIISCMHIIFMGNTVWRHSIWTITNLPNTNNSWHWWGYHPCWLYGRFLDGEVDQRIFGPSAAAPPEKPRRQLPVGVLWVSGQSNPKDGVHCRIIKEHLHNLVQCIDGSNYIMIY